VAVRDVLDKPQAALRVVEVAATVTHGVAVHLVTIVYQSWRTLPVGFSDAKARETAHWRTDTPTPMYLTGVLPGA
jgi:hypothetical protein